MAAVALATLAAGCGSHGSPAGSPQFGARVKAISTAYLQQNTLIQHAARAALIGGGAPAELAIFAQLRDATKTALDASSRLQPPKVAAAAYQHILTDLRTAFTALDHVVRLGTSDPNGLRDSLQQYAQALTDWGQSIPRLFLQLTSAPPSSHS